MKRQKDHCSARCTTGCLKCLCFKSKRKCNNCRCKNCKNTENNFLSQNTVGLTGSTPVGDVIKHTPVGIMGLKRGLTVVGGAMELNTVDSENALADCGIVSDVVAGVGIGDISVSDVTLGSNNGIRDATNMESDVINGGNSEETINKLVNCTSRCKNCTSCICVKNKIVMRDVNEVTSCENTSFFLKTTKMNIEWRIGPINLYCVKSPHLLGLV